MISDSVLAGDFNRPMAARTVEYVEQVASLSVFQGAAHIVDIGGGEGQLLMGIVARRIQCTGVIFDLAIQQSAAEQAIAHAALTERCRFESGDMFVAVPGVGDVYLLKWILHDWDDEGVRRILDVLRRCIPRTARIVIIERLMSPSIKESVALAQADLNMLVLNGGAERSLQDYEFLLRQAGFMLRAIEAFENRYGFHALIAELDGTT